MAITDEKKNLQLGQSVQEQVKNADDNFTSLFDTVDDLNDSINNSGFITKDVDNLTNYTVKGETGTDVELSIDNTTYVMTLKLKNAAGTVVSTATVDFPIESMVIGATYADGTLTLSLKNGETVDVDITAIVRGLVPDTRKINGKELKNNITLTQDDVGDGTTYKRFSATEKTKLAEIEAGANNYTHPTYTSKTSGLYKITVDATGHVSAVTEVQKSDITGLGIPEQDTTYNDATESKGGLMSAPDKAKLDAIDDSLKNVTADQIGKVKDVKLNGTSVLDETTGVAAINVDELHAEYVPVTTTSTAWTTKSINGTTYQALKVVETDTAVEMLNSSGQAVVAQIVRESGYIYFCVAEKIDCTLRKIGGNGVSGSSKLYRHRIYMSMTGGAYMVLVYYNRSSAQVNEIETTWNGIPVVGMHGSTLSPILHVDFNYENRNQKVKIYTVANQAGAEVYYENINVIDTVEEVV